MNKLQITKSMKYPLTTGLAWVGGLCWKHFGQYFENSIVEDHYTGIVATLAAHELGHK